ncbi:uncharacterized protein LOC115626236 isoform X3 [Scaptodrosophila lebanonensis]|uniref:Uncharacterized protein LOC115626236 isoform X3 n=1 Tax=Drosophila lebanonensis TaxID=7225 RepID=A0A6J2TR28_DROLE|nr:uncharacterized protein LOC115626236 isoform X3 [Scaptodrosophila lebanonensis]
MPSLARDILTYYKVIVIDSCIIDMTYLFYGLCVIISLIGYIIGGCMRSVKHVLSLIAVWSPVHRPVMTMCHGAGRVPVMSICVASPSMCIIHHPQ